LVLFPHTFDDLVSSDHPVRMVNDVLNKIDVSSLIGVYRKKAIRAIKTCLMEK